MSLTLIIINNAFEHDKQRVITGNNLYDMVRSVYPKGLPLNTYLYHDKWDSECDVTPQNQANIDHINRLNGRFYLVTYPSAALPLWAVVAVSVGVSLAVAFLMPVPEIPTGGSSQPPSPNNALAQRTNRQRLGGRVPDIFGTVWALPDLIAPSYSIYIDHKEVEYSYMCLGVGRYDVQKAYDDTTPIGYINGSTVSIFEPNKSFRDVPDVRFGSHLSTAEQGYLGLFVKRYGSVNGQVLPPPNNYLMLDDGVTFTPPNIIKIVGRSLNQFRAGGKLLIESATELTSIKQFLPPKSISGPNPSDADNTDGIGGTLTPQPTPILPYNLNGSYKIESVGVDSITLSQPEYVASDWERLSVNADTANGAGVVISTEEKPIWEGWFYTDLTDHDNVIVNLKAPNGLYTSYGNEWVTLGINCEVESELVDDNARPIQGTRHFKNIFIKSPKYENYLDGQGRAWVRTTDDDVRRTAAITAYIDNPHFGRGKKMRWRIRRKSHTITSNKGQVVQEVRVVDCYGVRYMSHNDTPKGVTTVYTKTLATEGALTVKERKLRLLVQRYLDSPTGAILSNRADDIIYHIAKANGLTDKHINHAQIKAEIDRLIEYFGTPLCGEFCGTFDNTNVTTEDMIQTVAQAAFSQAYRLNNQVHLHFERPQSHSMVGFNSHNILPDSYSYSESFGSRNDYDGVQVTYSAPVDDAKVTLSYPEGATNPQKMDLVGVRNKVQAHIHMMRLHHKNQYAYKTCELTGADESGVVIPTNRIDVANQLRSDTVQGSVHGLDSVGSVVLMSVSEPVALARGQTATVFVQTTAGILDNIKCTKHDDYTLKLSRMPSAPISIDGVVRAVYTLVTHSDTTKDSYIVTKKDVGDNPMTHKLTCINYTDKYYQNDKDFERGLIN